MCCIKSIINQKSKSAVDQVETYQYPSVVNTSFKISCVCPSDREMPTPSKTAKPVWLGCKLHVLVLYFSKDAKDNLLLKIKSACFKCKMLWTSQTPSLRNTTNRRFSESSRTPEHGTYDEFANATNNDTQLTIRTCRPLTEPHGNDRMDPAITLEHRLEYDEAKETWTW